MTRRELREQIFLLLFRMEFYQKEELDGQLLFSSEEMGSSDADASYIQDKVDAVVEKADEIDEIINGVAKGWKTTRMGKVDLALLRLAVFEIRYDADIPGGVAINEAVELAKKYRTDGSSSFVNGILARIV